MCVFQGLINLHWFQWPHKSAQGRNWTPDFIIMHGVSIWFLKFYQNLLVLHIEHVNQWKYLHAEIYLIIEDRDTKLIWNASTAYDIPGSWDKLHLPGIHHRCSYWVLNQLLSGYTHTHQHVQNNYTLKEKEKVNVGKMLQLLMRKLEVGEKTPSWEYWRCRGYELKSVPWESLTRRGFPIAERVFSHFTF